MRKRCDYYFAPHSPWTYLGHERFVEIVRRHDVQVDIKPMDIVKIFDAAGAVIPAKRPPQRQAYRLAELKRWSEHLRIPLNLHPKFFPVPTAAAARLIIAARLALGSDATLDVVGALLRAVWAEERDISDTETLIAIATGCGHDGKELMKASEAPNVQNIYDRCTEEAIAANVFGAPWYVVDGEGFWGQDRLDFFERALAG